MTRILIFYIRKLEPGEGKLVQVCMAVEGQNQEGTGVG